MTLLAGAFSRRGTLARADEWLASLSRHISRDASDARQVVRTPGAVLLKVDIGAFQVPAFADDGASVTFVAGEPLATGGDRASDTAALHHAFRDGSHDVLARARGQFAAAHLDRGANRLRLATDKLGIRALYWWTDGDTVVYASTLRQLESCELVPKALDLRGLAERLAIGYPLGARTPYDGISMLQAAEVVDFDGDGVRSARYWRWQDVAPSSASREALALEAFEVFREGARLRRHGDQATTAFLSGGLDSRAIVAVLRADDVDVHTFNFASAGTQEREFASQLAATAGTVHEAHEVNWGRTPAWTFTMADLLKVSAHPIRARVARPRVVFSGEGGSVGVGLVHVTPQLVAKAGAGDANGVADAFIEFEHVSVPARLLRADVAPVMVRAPREGILAELAAAAPASLAQRFYLFLMWNDQRRGLQPNLEHIDEHRLEQVMPFFDGEFLRVVASVPMEWRLYHGFYNDWLGHFPGYALTTPWQAYPGHVPCPVPVTRPLVQQWDRAARVARAKKVRRQVLPWALRTATRRDFASGVMKRSTVLMAAALHASGVRDFGYLLKGARTIQRYWAACVRTGVGDTDE